MKLNELKPPAGSKKKPKRIGCGPGSGHGKTACRGHKGQKARSGHKSRPWFEGGQMPLQRRVPKRGFHNIFKTTYEVVNVRELKRFDKNAEVGPERFREAGLVKKKTAKVKLLGTGELDRPLKVSVHACSQSARERVEKAGGEIRIIGK